MKPHVSILLGAWLFACLLITGCGDSTAPLSDASKASPDKRLIGVWQHRHQNGVTYYHVGRLGGKAPEGLMRVAIVSHPNSGELQEPHQLLAFRSDVGGHSYLNIAGVTQEQVGSLKDGWSADLLDSYILAGATQEQLRSISKQPWWTPDMAESYTVLRYRVDGDVLLVWAMNNKAKRKAIEGGKIKGEIKEDGRTRTRFTDTTQNLAQFVATAGNVLFFGEPLRLKRVK